jgi:ribonucleoside-diphosphate reductase alpha chain
MKKADLMGVIQRYVDSAISVTFNMPETATVEDIEKLYIKCWENKLKGVAIYREDPQNREPIFAFKRPKSYNYAPKKVAENTPSVWDNNFSDLEYSELIEFLKTNERIVAKRPQKLHGFTETVKAENHKFYFTYNFDENENLYEVFCQSNSKEPKVSTENAQNVLTALLERNDVPELLIEEQIEKSTHQSSPIKITRLISLGLRHGVTVEEIVQSLEELQVSVVSYIFHLRRSLSQFVKSRVSECPNCKEQTMIIEGGCKHCENCSYSGC